MEPTVGRFSSKTRLGLDRKWPHARLRGFCARNVDSVLPILFPPTKLVDDGTIGSANGCARHVDETERLGNSSLGRDRSCCQRVLYIL